MTESDLAAGLMEEKETTEDERLDGITDSMDRKV